MPCISQRPAAAIVVPCIWQEPPAIVLFVPLAQWAAISGEQAWLDAAAVALVPEAQQPFEPVEAAEAVDADFGLSQADAEAAPQAETARTRATSRSCFMTDLPEGAGETRRAAPND